MLSTVVGVVATLVGGYLMRRISHKRGLSDRVEAQQRLVAARGDLDRRSTAHKVQVDTATALQKRFYELRRDIDAIENLRRRQMILAEKPTEDALAPVVRFASNVTANRLLITRVTSQHHRELYERDLDFILAKMFGAPSDPRRFATNPRAIFPALDNRSYAPEFAERRCTTAIERCAEHLRQLLGD